MSTSRYVNEATALQTLAGYHQHNDIPEAQREQQRTDLLNGFRIELGDGASVWRIAHNVYVIQPGSNR